MAGSTAGTRWLAGQVARLTGDILAWETLDGTLLHSLRMQGLRVRLPGTAIDIQALNLQWRPILLATGVVQVDAFTADGIRIVVQPGIYREQIVCVGKSIQIEGAALYSF